MPARPPPPPRAPASPKVSDEDVSVDEGLSGADPLFPESGVAEEWRVPVPGGWATLRGTAHKVQPDHTRTRMRTKQNEGGPPPAPLPDPVPPSPSSAAGESLSRALETFFQVDSFERQMRVNKGLGVASLTRNYQQSSTAHQECMPSNNPALSRTSCQGGAPPPPPTSHPLRRSNP